jgi:hypothetical protein
MKSSRRWRRRCHHGIRSSRALPCLAAALLRCQRRVRGGGVRLRRLVYKSGSGLQFCCLGDGVGGVLHEGYFGSCGRGGASEVGSSSLFQRRESSASFDSGLEELGACPQPMFLQRILHSGLGVGCLLRLFQTFQAMGLLQFWGSHGLFFGGGGQRWFEGGCRWSLLVASKAFGVVFSQGPLCKMGGTAVFVSSSYVSGFVRVFVRIPYTVIQFSWI